VTIKPSSFSCSGADVQVSIAVRLSASFAGTTKVTSEVDGVASQTTTVSAGFMKQSDGSWLSSDAVSSASLCEKLAIGQHRLGAWDAAGKVITEGTLTLKP
jgi:hypothetical protein